jgi:hypothetical protein
VDKRITAGPYTESYNYQRKLRVTSGVPQGVLGQLLFLAYVNDIWKNFK